MLIWLASYPRSGNTMVRIVLRQVFDLNTLAIYRERTDIKDNIRAKLGFGGHAEDLEALRRDDRPHLVKTHDGPADDAPALCLVRDGRDVLVSYAHILARNPDYGHGRPFADLLRMLVVSTDQFGGWGNNVLSWRSRPASARTVWVKYEDMAGDPVGVLDAALRSVGVEPTQTGRPVPSFADLQREWPGFFRKGKAGGWREEMCDEVHELFWEHHGQAMEALGYSRAA